jgi:hypothetical protein
MFNRRKQKKAGWYIAEETLTKLKGLSQTLTKKFGLHITRGCIIEMLIEQADVKMLEREISKAM